MKKDKIEWDEFITNAKKIINDYNIITQTDRRQPTLALRIAHELSEMYIKGINDGSEYAITLYDEMKKNANEK